MNDDLGREFALLQQQVIRDASTRLVRENIRLRKLLWAALGAIPNDGREPRLVRRIERELGIKD